MRKKKILFLIPTLGGGGAERVLVNLVNGLDKSKYDLTVQTLFKAGINASYLNGDIKLIEGKIKQFSGNILLMKMFRPSISMLTLQPPKFSKRYLRSRKNTPRAEYIL